MSETILEMLHGEPVTRPGRVETAQWRLRWDADCVVAVRVGSMDEPVRSDGRGLIVQVSRALTSVRAPTVTRLFGGSAAPAVVHQLHVELRGRDLCDRVRLWARVGEPGRLDGLDELALDEADEVDSLEVLVDLLSTAMALGAGLARSGGAEVSAEALSALRQERDGQLVRAGRLERERDALRARVAELDGELRRVRATVSELEAQAVENARLRRQVDYLERQAAEADALRASVARLEARAADHDRLQRDHDRLLARLRGLERAGTSVRPTAAAHNLSLPAPPPAQGGAGVVCGLCQQARGESHELVRSALSVVSGEATLDLAGCPRCGAAQFVRSESPPTRAD